MQTSTKAKAAMGVLGALTIAGVAAWIYQLANGLGVTGMSNGTSWGLYITMFMFFVGLSAGGLIVASSASVFHVADYKKVALPAVILSTVCICCAGMFVLIDLGGIQRVWRIITGPNPLSPLFWDICVITLYLAINVVYLAFMTSKKPGAADKVAVVSRFALPVAILMAWYKPVRYIIEPWIQFIRNIPPLAYVPLIVIAAGVGRKPQIIVITIACFLIMCVTIYQGVINVDETLIKAARVLGATDKDIFIRVIAPATLPFILTAIRLGASVALTTLIAAESTGAMAGLGMRIRSLNNSFESAPMLLYIIIIGILGITIEKLIKTAERRLTSWQEKREI